MIVLQQSRKDGTKLDLEIRPQVVLECLQYLKEHNEAYKDVPISMENLQHYIDKDGKVEGLPTIYLEEKFETIKAAIEESKTITGEEIELTENMLEKDFPPIDSMVPNIVPTENLKTLVKEAIEKAGEKISIEQKEQFAYPKRLSTPLSEYDPFYYSKTYPHLFPNGLAEFRQLGRPGKAVNFLSWVTHLKNYKDDRFRTDPTWLMTVANQYKRKEELKVCL